MEKLRIMYSSRKYGLHKNDEFNVLRTINGDCVLLMPEDKPNIIITEQEAMTYGYLTGKPQIGGV